MQKTYSIALIITHGHMFLRLISAYENNFSNFSHWKPIAMTFVMITVLHSFSLPHFIDNKAAATTSFTFHAGRYFS